MRMSASRPPEFTHDTTFVTDAENRPRKSTGVVVLLVLLTIGNIVALMLVVGAWADLSSHGDEQLAGLLAFSVVLTVVALTGLGGAWATRKWGPKLYLGAVLIDRVVALVAASEMFPQAIAGLVLGVVLAAFLVRASSAW
jgi:hypothetical protein